jgi:hypothetical protein
MALKNQPRYAVDKDIILNFLKSMENFQISLKDNYTDDIDDILIKLSSCLRYEYSNENKIICNHGEKSIYQFYIILKGKSTIFIPEKIKICLTENDYLNYLINLRRVNQFEIIL